MPKLVISYSKEVLEWLEKKRQRLGLKKVQDVVRYITTKEIERDPKT